MNRWLVTVTIDGRDKGSYAYPSFAPWTAALVVLRGELKRRDFKTVQSIRLDIKRKDEVAK